MKFEKFVYYFFLKCQNLRTSKNVDFYNLYNDLRVAAYMAALM